MNILLPFCLGTKCVWACMKHWPTLEISTLYRFECFLLSFCTERYGSIFWKFGQRKDILIRHCCGSTRLIFVYGIYIWIQCLNFEETWIPRKNFRFPALARAKIFLLDIPVALCPYICPCSLSIKTESKIWKKIKNLNDPNFFLAFNFKILQPSNFLCHRFSNSTHE